jgi:hypothetical protein
MKRSMLSGTEGNISLAVTLTMIAMVAGLTMSSLALRDNGQLMLENDGLQQFHFVRTEILRGENAVGNLQLGDVNTELPIRKVEVNHGVADRAYAMKTKVERVYDTADNAVATQTLIRTKIKSFNRDVNAITYNSTVNKSMVEKYAEKTIRKETFAGYMYLTNTDQSVNEDPVYFNGYDEFWGRVHSNTDIWLQSTGGWPVFHAKASTGGTFLAQSGSIPYAQVFPGGYEEHAAQIYFPKTAELIRNNGLKPWGSEPDPSREILLVNLESSGFTYSTGDIHTYPPEQYVIYNSYPPFGPIGDSIGVATYVPRDTIWTIGQSVSVQNRSVWCPGEVWIRGEEGGKQTFGSLNNMYLIGDITYQHTEPGDDPDEGNVNAADYLGLVSEQSIIIKYAMVDPDDPLHPRRHLNNCDLAHPGPAEDVGIYIYAALCALGNDDDSHLDGVFTFEYQHPHRSTPNVNYQSEWFNNVDLHLGVYPPVAGHYWPWPAGTATGFNYPATYGNPAWPDYPYYNPIWPEYNPMLKRGCIYLFGSVAQQRRGFINRSFMDAADQGWWDMNVWRYGQSCAGLGYSATNAQGSGVGYNKAYHYDSRFMLNAPPDFPEVQLRGGETPFQGIALRMKRPPRNF